MAAAGGRHLLHKVEVAKVNKHEIETAVDDGHHLYKSYGNSYHEPQ
jgi:hypothetical protein